MPELTKNELAAGEFTTAYRSIVSTLIDVDSLDLDGRADMETMRSIRKQLTRALNSISSGSAFVDVPVDAL